MGVWAEQQRIQYAAMARGVVDDLAIVLHEPPLDPTPTSPDAFPHLDRRWLDRATTALEARGFRRMRDLDGRAVTAPGAPPMMLRVMLDAAGTTSAGLYQAIPRSPGLITQLVLRVLGKWPGSARVVELMSYAGDRAWSTSNQGTLNLFSPPPWLERESLPLDATPDALIERHRARVAGHRLDAYADFDQMNAARNAMRERNNAWREVVGLLPEELDRMLAPHGATGVAMREHIIAELASRRAPSQAPSE